MVRCIIIKNCLSESGLLVIARVLPLHVGKGFVQRLAGTEWDLPVFIVLYRLQRHTYNCSHSAGCYSCGDNDLNSSGVRMATKRAR